MDRMIQQLLNRFLGQLMNRAIDGGIKFAQTRGRDPAQMTEAEHEQARSAQELAKKARKLSRASRKLF